MEQAVKNLSLQRAMAVRSSYLAYCKGKGVNVDESQLVPVGMGIKTPKFPVPHTKQEWDANRRVVFLIKNVEAEATEFAPTPSK
jgi:outer membrane protein OmpA-like peptidoglycan-associated protein